MTEIRTPPIRPWAAFVTAAGAVLSVFLFPYFSLAALNPDDLATPLTDYLESGYLWIVLGAAGIVVCATILLVRLLPRSWALISALFVAVTVCVYLQSNFLVWNYGVLDGSKFEFGGKTTVAVVELVVWLAVFVGALRWRHRIANIAPQIILSVVVLQAVSVGWGLVQASEDNKHHKARKVLKLSTDRNIIIYISDGLQGDLAEKLLNSQETKLKDALQGFTFYSNAISHHRATLLSVPSLLSGMPFFGAETYDVFRERQERHNIGNALKESGFHTFMISEKRYCAGLSPCLFRWSLTKRPALPTGSLAQIINLTGFRIVPHVLKEATFDGVQGIGDVFGGAGLKGGMWGSVAKEAYFYTWLAKNLQASTDEPVFAVFHDTASHHPYVLSSDCQAREVRMNPQGLMDQYVCEMRLFKAFIKRLKTLGVYDKSLIFWVSDHGSRAAFLNGDDELKVVNQEAHATLAVKPVGAIGPLIFSQAPVSLADVAPTIAAEAGIETPNYEGVSLLGDLPASRDRYFVWNPPKKVPKKADLKTYRLRGNVNNPQDWARSHAP